MVDGVIIAVCRDTGVTEKLVVQPECLPSPKEVISSPLPLAKGCSDVVRVKKDENHAHTSLHRVEN